MCPNNNSRGKDGNKVAPNVPKDDVQGTRHFYAFQTKGSKPDENYDEDESKSLHFLFSDMSSF